MGPWGFFELKHPVNRELFSAWEKAGPKTSKTVGTSMTSDSGVSSISDSFARSAIWAWPQAAQGTGPK